MPQFANHRKLTPQNYRSVARRVRELADAIESRADAKEPRERAALSRHIATLSHVSRALWRRHNGISVASDIMRKKKAEKRAAGRPPIDGKPRRRYNIMLPDDVVEWLDRSGNRSEAVTRLVREQILTDGTAADPSRSAR